jgi:leukotriene-A4 hydrolase
MVTDMSNYGFNNSFSSLHPDLSGGRNPDDSFSEVPYEKGFQFLAYIESIVGEGVFQEFLRYYVHNFRRNSITYEQLEALFNEFIRGRHPALLDTVNSKIDWKVWIYTPGVPNVNLNFSSSNITASKNLAQAYLSLNGTGSPSNFRDFIGYDPMLKGIFLQYFIDRSDNVSTQLLERIAQDYNLTGDLHHDILTPWFTLQLRKGYVKDLVQIKDYLATTGRMLYILPLYRELYNYNPALAVEIFKINRNFYHPIATGFIVKILHL